MLGPDVWSQFWTGGFTKCGYQLGVQDDVQKSNAIVSIDQLDIKEEASLDFAEPHKGESLADKEWMQ